MTLPTPRYDRDGIRLYAGDALAILPEIEAGSVDAVVTDPPAGIAFMGKEWDTPGEWRAPISEHGFTDGAARRPAPTIGSSRNPMCRKCHKHRRGSEACRCESPDFDDRSSRLIERDAFVGFLTAILAECFRIAKPGARLLCWAIPRTSHWTGTAIEDAGWIIEDRVSHLFGQGFPKHKSKLKPACEDWWLAWKPDRKATALNIDECRIAGHVPDVVKAAPSTNLGVMNDDGWSPTQTDFPAHPAGRWPANVVLSHHPDCQCVGTKRVKGSNAPGPAEAMRNHGVDYGRLESNGNRTYHADPDGLETVSAWQCVEGCPVAELDQQSGTLKSGRLTAENQVNGGFAGTVHCYGKGATGGTNQYEANSGGASRFFYCRDCADAYPPEARDAHLHGHVTPDGKPDWRHVVSHPTQKSEDLMRWLCRLIAKPGDTILDAFAGSGSTLKAAALEGMRAIGSEREAEYVEIARRRLREAETPLFSALTG